MNIVNVKRKSTRLFIIAYHRQKSTTTQVNWYTAACDWTATNYMNARWWQFIWLNIAADITRLKPIHVCISLASTFSRPYISVVGRPCPSSCRVADSVYHCFSPQNSGDIRLPAFCLLGLVQRVISNYAYTASVSTVLIIIMLSSAGDYNTIMRFSSVASH